VARKISDCRRKSVETAVSKQFPGMRKCMLYQNTENFNKKQTKQQQKTSQGEEAYFN